MVALALSASSMMLKAPPPDVVQHFVHVPVRRRGTPVSAVSVATPADVDDGQSNRVCRRPAAGHGRGPVSASPAPALTGDPADGLTVGPNGSGWSGSRLRETISSSVVPATTTSGARPEG